MFYRVIFFLPLLFISAPSYAALPGSLLKQYPGALFYENHIQVAAPDIAENASFVPLGIKSIKLPTDRYVTSVAIYNLTVSSCPISVFNTGPATYVEGLTTRVRVNYENNPLYVVAQLDNGDILTGNAIVKASFRCCSGGCDFRPRRLGEGACVRTRL